MTAARVRMNVSIGTGLQVAINRVARQGPLAIPIRINGLTFSADFDAVADVQQH